MAKRDIVMPEGVVDTPQLPTASTGPIPGTVRLLNLTSGSRDITLLDGTNVRLAPFNKGNQRWSEPIPKKLLPEPARKMAARREIQIREEVA